MSTPQRRWFAIVVPSVCGWIPGWNAGPQQHNPAEWHYRSADFSEVQCRDEVTMTRLQVW